MKFIKLLTIPFFLIGLFCSSKAQTGKDSLRILFVGNSYTSMSNIPNLVSLISDSTNVKLVTAKSTMSGATLSNHWNGEKGLKTKEAISSGKYDIVVLQGMSMETIESKDDFLKYSKKLSDLVKASGAKPYLYVTWAREKTPELQDTITNVYKQAAKANECDLILVGEAWKLARQQRPDIPLYMPDGSHQSNVGAFLTACVFVNYFAGEILPTLRSNYNTIDTNGEKGMVKIDNTSDVMFCQQVATDLLKVKQ